MAIYKGPRPYGEVDEEGFFGRDDEIADIVDLIEHNRLAVVTAPSGVGKTSVLLAGVVPKLRRRHEGELLDDAVALGPTLVCRTWSGRTERSAEKILTDAIAEAIGDLFKPDRTVFLRATGDDTDLLQLLNAEAEALQGVVNTVADVPPESLNWRELMTACADKVSRLTLIFDQFEDALRLPIDGGKKLLRTISTLYQQEPRVRVLLSFRQEFIMRMHDLEVSIGGLFKRTYYLQSVTPDSVEAIVRGPADKVHIEVKDEAIETLKDWITNVPSVKNGGDPRNDADGTSAAYVDEGGTFPLLALQALLVDVFEVLVETGQRQVIDADSLKEYVRLRGLQPQQLAQNALEHHIIKVMTTPTGGETSKMLDRYATGARPDEKNVLLQRLFARMPQHLTSGSRPGSPGYKKQISIGMLIEESLKDDFATLNASFRATQLDDLLNFVKNPASAVVDIKESQDRTPDDDPLSGIARRTPRWTPGRTTQVLVLAVAELLRRLVEGNVLKPLGSGGEAAFELVHDGLGPPVLRWAEKFRKKPEDALASLTRLNGITFPWAGRQALKEGTEVSNASWTGCVVANQDLFGVSFRDCKLSGTMFIGCSFHGATFQNCDLNGAMFVKSKFFPAKDETNAKPCSFHGGEMQSALFSRCEFHGDSAVEGVNLNGTVFVSNDVYGKLSMCRSSLEVVVFRNCEYQDGGYENEDSGIFIADCDFTFSRILAGVNSVQTPVYLAGNQMHPVDASLFTHDPGHKHWKPLS